MGPKKAPKKAKAKGGSDTGGLDLSTPESKIQYFQSQALSLTLSLNHQSTLLTSLETSASTSKIQRDAAVRAKEEEEERLWEVTRDMTRQYKGMQEELLTRINALEDTLIVVKDELQTSKTLSKKMLREKDLVILEKEKENEALNAKMEDMAAEFGDMLKETLDKMRERIELNSGAGVNNSSGSGSNGNGSSPMVRSSKGRGNHPEMDDVNVQRRLEEFNLKGDDGRK